MKYKIDDKFVMLKEVCNLRKGDIVSFVKQDRNEDLVKDLYNDDDRFYNNANLLWIMRGFGETYTVREEIKNEI